MVPCISFLSGPTSKMAGFFRTDFGKTVAAVGVISSICVTLFFVAKADVDRKRMDLIRIKRQMRNAKAYDQTEND